jgi:hypothetical protein
MHQFAGKTVGDEGDTSVRLMSHRLAAVGEFGELQLQNWLQLLG